MDEFGIKNEEIIEDDKISEEDLLPNSALYKYFGERAIISPYELNGTDAGFTVFALISALFSVFAGLFGGFALGFTISFCILFCVLAVYLSKGSKPSPYAVLCAIMSLLISAVFTLTSNGLVRFLSFIAIFALSAVFFEDMACCSRADGDLGIIVNIVYSTFGKIIPNMPRTIKSLLIGGNGKRKTLGKVIIGIACAIPALLIIIPLLISSDLAFESLVNRLFSNISSTIIKLVLSLILGWIIISFGFSMKKDAPREAKESTFSGVENIYVISFLSVLSLCYAMYMLSQLAYFFSAFSGILPKGKFNVADYARRGFFELTAIAAINLAIIFISLIILKKSNAAVKALCTFVSIFTILLSVTALSKMLLYIKSFAMTELRIITCAFMIFIFIVFISVIIRIYLPRTQVLKTALITAAGILLILGTVNVNSVVAKYNYEAYSDGRITEIDVEKIYNTGAEGVPYLIELTKSPDEEISNNAKFYLYLCYRYDFFEDITEDLTVNDFKTHEKYSGIKSFSLPRARAYKELYSYLRENPDFYTNRTAHSELL